MICSDPVVMAQNFSKPYKLAVDASALESSVVLFQENEEKLEHLVSYISKSSIVTSWNISRCI